MTEDEEHKVFTDEQLNRMNPEDIANVLYLDTPYEMLGFAISVEQGKGRETRFYHSNDVIAIVTKYQGIVAEFKKLGINNRMVQLLMISMKLVEDLTQEEIDEIKSNGKAPAVAHVLDSWIGVELNVEEVHSYLDKHATTGNSEADE